MEQTIACSLNAADYAARRQQTAEIARDALMSRDLVEGGARLTFAATDATERELREVIAAEADCCSFLRFELDRDGETLRLNVTGPADAQPIIAELFA
jgi:hypothetical protein